VGAGVTTTRKEVRCAIEIQTVHSKAQSLGDGVHDIEGPVVVGRDRGAPDELPSEFNWIYGDCTFRHAATVTVGSRQMRSEIWRSDYLSFKQPPQSAARQIGRQYL
jgi:hypothetical protein